jgi:hypothetical protein
MIILNLVQSNNLNLSKTLLPSLFLFVCSAFGLWFVPLFGGLFIRSFVCYFIFLVARSFIRLLVRLQRSKIFNFEEMSTRGKTTKRMNNCLGVWTYKHSVCAVCRSGAPTNARTHTCTHACTHAQTNKQNARGSNFTKFW